MSLKRNRWKNLNYKEVRHFQSQLLHCTSLAWFLASRAQKEIRHISAALTHIPTVTLVQRDRPCGPTEST